MTAEKFAKTYANNIAVISNYTDGLDGIVGRIIGYDCGSHGDSNHCVIIENDPVDNNIDYNSYLTGFVFHGYSVVDISTIQHKCLRIQPKYLSILYKPTSPLPDNCDDCGAIGEQPCKDNCPNK